VLFLGLLIALIVVPLLEIYVVIQVAHAIGLLATVALLLLDALAGAALMRSQGRVVFSRARQTLLSGRAPTREILDGALVLVGGALLLAPGFITDLFGALLLLPPTRSRARKLIVGHFTRRFAKGTANVRFSTRSSSDGPAYDVEGSVVEVEDRGLER
jgi:UPF0716 protein FxsA